MLQLTDKAVDKVKELLTTESKEGYGLRVAIHGGGCSGFQYGCGKATRRHTWWSYRPARQES